MDSVGLVSIFLLSEEPEAMFVLFVFSSSTGLFLFPQPALLTIFLSLVFSLKFEVALTSDDCSFLK